MKYVKAVALGTATGVATVVATVLVGLSYSMESSGGGGIAGIGMPVVMLLPAAAAGFLVGFVWILRRTALTHQSAG